MRCTEYHRVPYTLLLPPHALEQRGCPETEERFPALPCSQNLALEMESTHLTSCFVFHRIFSSNLKERMAQRFYNLVLLPRVRDDIAEYKRLNFHLYMALKKALFKPGAWFKGRRSL